ncbi:pca operon transcription factor PcaQ [Sagittula salina]|uniref:Pca operon transcription factor PcaQ n=1 Tax=Sagittula salina TaxID=2820268 RepID=A0A940MV02_9RHOB|nr:pca operon transcription factor PcaQ [Sagittula salina]MBP0483419.1 pca operon transcription factor PcaQ [Sagittula salina]
MITNRIKLRHLEALTAIARQGSLRAACEQLHLSPPALSKTLKELEETLGTTLMHRDRGGIRMTPEGALFLRFANQSLAALHRGVEGLTELREGGAETLRVGALPSVAARLMPQAVATFRKVAPDTRLMLRDGAHGALTAALRAGQLDMVVGRMGVPAAMQGLSFTQLYVEQVVCVSRAGHPLAQAPMLDHIGDWPVLYPPEDAAIRPLVDGWCLSNGLQPFPDRIDCVSGAFGRNYLPVSDAVWFISEGVVAQDLSEGRLTALAIDLDLTAGPVGLMTRPEATTTRSQQLFEQSLRVALES